MHLVEYPEDRLTSEEFKEKYGTIVEDLKTDDYSVYFYPIYLIRRLGYAAALISLYYFPRIQIGLITVFLLIPVLFFPVNF